MNRNVYHPLFAKMGINSQAELDKRTEEVTKKLAALTVKEALENLGYTYDDSRPSHAPKRPSRFSRSALPPPGSIRTGCCLSITGTRDCFPTSAAFCCALTPAASRRNSAPPGR